MSTWYILISFFYLVLSSFNSFAVSGPYKSVVLRLSSCEHPTRPYIKNPPLVFEQVLHNTSKTSLLSGNYTFLSNIKNIKLQIKSFIWENYKWKPQLLLTEFKCNGLPLYFMCKAVNIKYDRKTCTLFKGVYSFKDLDVNALQHIWLSRMEYGRTMIRTETFLSTGTLTCMEFVTENVPA